ncbi:MAG: LysM peptidoglycan-binding domain-containing protein [Acidimicrobiales bacterium]
MAAVIISNSPVAGSSAGPRPVGVRRPELRVIPGGRRAARRGSASIYRRRRLGALVAVVVVVGVLYLAAVGAAALIAGRSSAGVATEPAPAVADAVSAPSGQEAARGSREVREEVYVVQPGDTLWSIARHLQPEGEIRPLVDRLADRNGGAALHVGQRLRLDGLAG